MKTKDELRTLYKDVKEKLGRIPGYNEFISETGITKYCLAKRFLSYQNLLAEFGDTPRIINNHYNDKVYIDAYADFIRAHLKIPTCSEWDFYNCKPTYPAFINRFNVKWNGMPSAFYDYAKDKDEYRDVISILNEKYWAASRKKTKRLARLSKGLDQMTNSYYKFIPPVLRNFKSISHLSDASFEFEEKCAVAMKMLGFSVTKFGQGYGRNPDGIAKDFKNRYAVIYDAKTRAECFTLGTQDRAIKDYIKKYKKDLQEEGIELVYFLIISSAFGKFSTFRIQEETGIVTSLITAENLLRIISKKIESPEKCATAKLKEFFVMPGEITTEEINKLLN